MPAQFDAPAVQKLIDNIEKPPNATILRSGYFMRRGAHPLPTEEGFTLLQTVTEKEPIETKRWFVLESTQAFAAFRLTGANADAGYAAYDTLFQHADKAAQADSLYTLRQAVNDYLFLVQGRFRDLGLREDERTIQTLGNAWAAYVSALAQEAKTKPTYVVPEPMWAEAIDVAGMPDGFEALVEKTLADPAISKSYSLYKTAIAVFERGKPERVLSVLKQARPLLPKDNLNEAGWYFSKLVNLLEQQATYNAEGQGIPLDKAKLAEAIAAQKDMVKTTGRGRSRLADLRYKGGDEKAYADMVAQLSAADAPEVEIIEAASTLARLARQTGKEGKPSEKYSALQVDFLTKYLAAPRERDVSAELQARFMLGLYYVNTNQPEAARAVLKIDHLTIPSRGRARYDKDAIDRLLKSMEEPAK